MSARCAGSCRGSSRQPAAYVNKRGRLVARRLASLHEPARAPRRARGAEFRPDRAASPRSRARPAGRSPPGNRRGTADRRPRGRPRPRGPGNGRHRWPGPGFDQRVRDRGSSRATRARSRRAASTGSAVAHRGRARCRCPARADQPGRRAGAAGRRAPDRRAAPPPCGCRPDQRPRPLDPRRSQQADLDHHTPTPCVRRRGETAHRNRNDSCTVERERCRPRWIRSSVPEGGGESMGVRVGAARLAWPVWGLCVALTAVALVLFVINGDARPEGSLRLLGCRDRRGDPGLSDGRLGRSRPRQPGNAIGWLFLATGLWATARAGPARVRRLRACSGRRARCRRALGRPPGRRRWSGPSVAATSLLVFCSSRPGTLPSRRWRWLVLGGGDRRSGLRRRDVPQRRGSFTTSRRSRTRSGSTRPGPGRVVVDLAAARPGPPRLVFGLVALAPPLPPFERRGAAADHVAVLHRAAAVRAVPTPGAVVHRPWSRSAA